MTQIPPLPAGSNFRDVLREATYDLAAKLAVAAETMTPSSSPGETARAIYACTAPITSLCMGLEAWQRHEDTKRTSR